MIDKRVATPSVAVAGIRDGSVVLIGGFGASGIPVELINALIDQGAKDLTVVTNNAGSGRTDLLLISSLSGLSRIRRAV
jgi:3-oxoadipate CoA-transferase alpha subunit